MSKYLYADMQVVGWGVQNATVNTTEEAYWFALAPACLHARPPARTSPCTPASTSVHTCSTHTHAWYTHNSAGLLRIHGGPSGARMGISASQ